MTIWLKKSDVKLKVAGQADSKTFQTFFPPYTIVSEGNTDLSEDEKFWQDMQQDAKKAFSSTASTE